MAEPTKDIPPPFSFDPVKYRTYVDVMAEVFRQRCESDADYSLRKFSDDLGISFPRLSQIMNGKSGLSVSSARRIGQALGLDSDFLEFFVDLVMAHHARSETEKRLALVRLQKYFTTPQYQDIAPIAVDALSKWYYIPLLELTGLNPEGAAPESLALALKLDLDVTIEALDKLVTLGVLEVSKGGRYCKKFRKMVIERAPLESLKTYHREILRLATEALDSQPFSEQLRRVTTVPIQRGLLAEARLFLLNMEKEFLARFEAGDRADAVYCFGFQLFKLADKESL